MTKKHVMLAFGIKTSKDIDELIADGWIYKYYQYFRPTGKLYEYNCPDSIEIKDFARLNGRDRFGYMNIEEIFDCDAHMAKIIAQKYFIKSQFGFFKRSDKLNELLANGETKLELKDESITN